MALPGISEYRADFSFWAKVIPPLALIACSPSVPSEPIPERMTPMARLCLSSASEHRNPSIGCRVNAIFERGERVNTSLAIVILALSGMT